MRDQTTNRWISIALLAVFLISGCGGPESVPVAATGTPAARVTGTAGEGTSTPGAGSFSWLRIALPQGWRETGPGQYAGADGFARLELLDSQGAGPAAVCMMEANGGKPDRYGAYPEIRDERLEEQPACLILPSADQPASRKAEAVYLLWLPEYARSGVDGEQDVLALYADRPHIEAIAAGLGFTRSPTSEPTALTCDFSITGSPANTIQEGSVRIDEFPIARGEGCTPYQAAAAFNEQARNSPAGARSERVVGRLYQGERMNRLNSRLQPFGFRVETYDNLFRVVRGGKVLKDNLSWVGHVSVRADGQDFIFPALDGYNATAYLVRPNGVQALDDPDLLVFDQVFPVYAGEKRISLRYDYERYPRPYSSPALLEIYEDDTLLDVLAVSGSNPAKGPARGLWSWQDAQGAPHWTMEVAGLVIEDGENLNERLGTPEIFTWRLLKDRPFYFYRAERQVRAVYDGETLPLAYDEVIADPQFSDRILIQMKTYESALVFYARKGGVWHLVVIEVE